jgi:hypothetical protein
MDAGGDMSEGNLEMEGRSLEKLVFLVMGDVVMSSPSGLDVRCVVEESMMSGGEDAVATAQLMDRRIGIQEGEMIWMGGGQGLCDSIPSSISSSLQ